MTHSTTAPGRRRGLGVRGKILAVGAAGMAAAIGLGTFAMGELSDGGEALERVGVLGEALSHVETVKYYDGDVSGWQVAYAWDARRIGPVEAVQPDSGNRAGYLADADALRAELAAVPTEVLTADEAAIFDRIVEDWDAFFAIDDEVVALFEQNTPASTDAADAMILGDGYDVYFEIFDLTEQLRSSLKDRVQDGDRERCGRPQAEHLDHARCHGAGRRLRVRHRAHRGPPHRPPAGRGDGRGHRHGRRRPDPLERRRPERRGRAHRGRAGPRPGEPARGPGRGRVLGGRGRGVVGGAVGVLGADLGVGAEETSAQSGVVSIGRRGGLAQRADGRGGCRADGRLDPGDRVERGGGQRGRGPRGGGGGDDDGDGGEAGRVLGRDRQRGQGHHEHRGADEPAGAERDDRGGAGRRGGQGLRGRRERGQGAGAGDGEGDRGHRPPGAGDPGRHHRRGRGDRGDLERSSAQISDRQTTIASRRWRSRRPRPARCRGRCRRPPTAPTEIATNITGVSTAAESTTQALAQTRTAVDELSRMAADLRTSVGRFTY